MTVVAVVEVHGFTDDKNRFLVKELAVVGDCFHACLVFRPPYESTALNCDSQRRVRWLERHYHRILWDEGCVRFSFALVRNLLRPFDIVYTKGLEKGRFLSKCHGNVAQLDESWKVPSHFDCTTACCLPQHRGYAVCAVRSASFYYLKLDKGHRVSSTIVDDEKPTHAQVTDGRTDGSGARASNPTCVSALYGRAKPRKSRAKRAGPTPTGNGRADSIKNRPAAPKAGLNPVSPGTVSVTYGQT